MPPVRSVPYPITEEGGPLANTSPQEKTEQEYDRLLRGEITSKQYVETLKEQASSGRSAPHAPRPQNGK